MDVFSVFPAPNRPISLNASTTGMPHRNKKGRTKNHKKNKKGGRFGNSKPAGPIGNFEDAPMLPPLRKAVGLLSFLIQKLNTCEMRDEAETTMIALAALLTQTDCRVWKEELARLKGTNAAIRTDDPILYETDMKWRLGLFAEADGIPTLVDTLNRWGHDSMRCATEVLSLIALFVDSAPDYVLDIVDNGGGEAMISFAKEYDGPTFAEIAVHFFFVAVEKASPKVATDDWTDFVVQAVTDYPFIPQVQNLGRQYISFMHSAPGLDAY
jgi:hypothetical protein